MMSVRPQTLEARAHFDKHLLQRKMRRHGAAEQVERGGKSSPRKNYVAMVHRLAEELDPKIAGFSDDGLMLVTQFKSNRLMNV